MTAKIIFALLIVTLATPVHAATISSVDATVVRVIDGDSIVVKAQIWIKQTVETTVRLNGVDTPELKGKCKAEKDKAKAAKAYVQSLLKDRRITLHNVKRDKYGGRVLADVTLPDGSDLRERLIDEGYARPYGGGKRRGWCHD